MEECVSVPSVVRAKSSLLAVSFLESNRNAPVVELVHLNEVYLSLDLIHALRFLRKTLYL